VRSELTQTQSVSCLYVVLSGINDNNLVASASINSKYFSVTLYSPKTAPSNYVDDSLSYKATLGQTNVTFLGLSLANGLSPMIYILATGGTAKNPYTTLTSMSSTVCTGLIEVFQNASLFCSFDLGKRTLLVSGQVVGSQTWSPSLNAGGECRSTCIFLRLEFAFFQDPKNICMKNDLFYYYFIFYEHKFSNDFLIYFRLFHRHDHRRTDFRSTLDSENFRKFRMDILYNIAGQSEHVEDYLGRPGKCDVEWQYDRCG
jgi:hypothetical protein